ncbi:MAG: tetratricopeptide repeat protein [Magnetococcales bacterium]|nr:tetratricopeptide repeat protein [Magnetococcales bacterium]
MVAQASNFQAIFQQGMALHQQGALDEALARFEAISPADAHYAEALHRQGLIARQQGRMQDARRLIEYALAANPKMAPALNNLGITRFDLGDRSGAMACYRKALALQPNNPMAYNNLGHLLRLQGRLEAAGVALHRAIVLKPDLAEAHNNLGLTHKDRGQIQEAMRSFERAIHHKPTLAAAHNNLGNLLVSKNRFQEAHDHFRQALKIRPNYPDALGNLGNTLRMLERLEEAEVCYRQALELNPQQAATYNNLGVTLKGLGRLEEARTAFEQAVTIDPSCAIAYRHMVSCGRMRETNHYTEAMQRLYTKRGISRFERTNLAFALGKLHEDLGDHRRAFDHLAAGNRMERTRHRYFVTEDEARFGFLQEMMDADFLARWQRFGVEDKAPIFILGMPRSGTTLAEQILSSHPQVYGAGERVQMPLEVQKLWREISHNSGGRVGPPVSWRQDSRALSGEQIRTMGQRYLEALHACAPESPYIVDKMPNNYMHIGWILSALPKAKIIHCVRHPMGTCFSIFKTLFSEPHPYAYHLSELGRYYRAYQSLMAHWHRVAPGRIYDLSYEALVADQERETRLLLEHCNLGWDARCMAFHKNKRVVTTASVSQVRKPIYSSSVMAWENYRDSLEPLWREFLT